MKAREVVENLKWLGADRMLLLSKDTKGKVLYPSGVAPAKSGVGRTYSDMVDEARDEGISVDAWLCLFPEDMVDVNPIVRKNPDILLVNRYGESNWERPTWSDVDPKYSTFWACPSAEQYVQYLESILREIAGSYRVDGLHMDYVRYPEAVEGRYYCYCHRCLRRFEQEYGYKFPTREVIHIRHYISIMCENVTGTVEKLSNAARGRGLTSSAYVFTDYVTAIESCYQDWPYFSRFLDYIVPTLYEVSPGYAGRMVSRARLVTDPKTKVVPAVYANRVVRRAVAGARRWTLRRGAEYIYEIAESCLEAGAKGIALFHYKTIFHHDTPNSLSPPEVVELRDSLKSLGLP